ncbi:MAG: hypothetical protein HRT88_00185 [Lentisphaeraceae bacterium]|nr:hypothetical protein [Lentisphaeraceae bacterium]
MAKPKKHLNPKSINVRMDQTMIDFCHSLGKENGIKNTTEGMNIVVNLFRFYPHLPALTKNEADFCITALNDFVWFEATGTRARTIIFEFDDLEYPPFNLDETWITTYRTFTEKECRALIECIKAYKAMLKMADNDEVYLKQFLKIKEL